MKQKLSITIDAEKLKEIERFVRDGRFRNKSHAVEYSLDRLIEEGGKGR